MRMPIGTDEEPKFQIAPMIDCVFQLLIFFMVASRLATIQNIELEIPLARHAVVPKERPDRVVVNITKDGKVHAGDVPVTLSELKVMVKQYKDINPNVKIYLRADQESEHMHMRKVMNAMAELGVDDFIVGAFIPGD